jgi:hypothetical protein
VKRAILQPLAVEQQERVDEKRKVVDERDVERAVLFDQAGGDVEDIAEVDARLGFGRHWLLAGPPTLAPRSILVERDAALPGRHSTGG